ncbi:MAG: ImmA/IrrE family metallo-endopeptidase [Clostridiales bacterium]|jgi:Zn-dependent peptidase ImmA (M78 family)|nr:ImmA/IrrE family metallo-endopeptidase [Clostridiales bacterium]
MNYVLRETQKLLKEFGTSNPRELADYLDITVINYPLAKLRGIYCKIKEQKFAVINSKLSNEEQKYTLLHEIAHARLHPQINYFAINKNKLIISGKYELQADLFASALYILETPDEYKAVIGKQLLGKLPEIYLKKIFINF